ncbi:hypothetical protein ACIBJF_18895 [Streptomyces sp. NPDC050743]|uniref:hypothetical protein n=1 Tax=Streptomyces sp. NPDC050743 TaxID=3365634 RepID=UPI0037B9A56C
MSLFPSCLDLLDRPTACPGCRAYAPGWVRVPVDGLSVLTHDGDLICPADPTFGASVSTASPVVLVEVAA